jgi:hypothetical protein
VMRYEGIGLSSDGYSSLIEKVEWLLECCDCSFNAPTDQGGARRYSYIS